MLLENSSALRLVHDDLVLLGNRQCLFFAHFSLLPANRLEIAGLQLVFASIYYSLVHYNIISQGIFVNRFATIFWTALPAAPFNLYYSTR